MIDFFATPDAGEDLVFFTPSIMRDDQPDVLSDCLGRRIAEEALGGWIPGHDHALESLADNHVVGRLDDRSKMSLDVEKCSGMAQDAASARGQNFYFRFIELGHSTLDRIRALPHLLEAVPDFADECFGLLEGGKVSALGQLVEVLQVGESLLGPSFRGAEYLFRENRAADRDCHRIRQRGAEALPV